MQWGENITSTRNDQIRVRPPNEKEQIGKWRHIIKVLDKHVLIFDPATNKGSSGGFIPNSSRSRDYKYAFDRVFDDTATQQEVFEETTKGLIDAVLNGFNATVFAYGATGFLLHFFTNLFRSW